MGSLSSLPPSQRYQNYGPFVVTPRYIALPFETPRLDNLVAHDSRVNHSDVTGFFCGSPVITMDEEGMDADVIAAVYVNVALGKAQRAEGLDSIPAEVLPGEEICADNIIRRSTTAEAIGEAFYAQLETNVVNGGRVTLEDAKSLSDEGAMLTWFGTYAVLHGEEA
jgi:hypothetical protein